MRIASLIIAAAGLAAVTMPAHAYRYRTCDGIALKMPSNNITTFASANSFPTGYWRDGLQNAINQFNRNPSNVFYTLATDTNGLGLNNGQNEVWGSSDQAILQGAPAIAYSYWDCYWWFGTVARMKEGDVIFDYTNTAANPFEWTATRSKTALFNYTGSGRLLQATAIHEFGHAAGLLHEANTYNVMGSDFSHVHTNGATTNAYIGENTGNGLVVLYGLWASGPLDLGVVHWRRVGFSGEYSTHDRTRIFNAATGAVLPTINVAGETGFQVRRGQTIRAEFTYENNGRATVTSAPLRYYVSSNDTISTTDRLLASSTITLSRDSVSTASVTLTIPTNLPFANHWLGVVINPTGSIAETDTHEQRDLHPHPRGSVRQAAA